MVDSNTDDPYSPVPMLVGAAVMLALFLPAAFSAGQAAKEQAVWDEYKECRLLLSTRDSAVVLSMRPECGEWTYPPKRVASERDLRREFRECRHLITTQDSVVLVTIRPECYKWTRPAPPHAEEAR